MLISETQAVVANSRREKSRPRVNLLIRAPAGAPNYIHPTSYILHPTSYIITISAI